MENARVLKGMGKNGGFWGCVVANRGFLGFIVGNWVFGGKMVVCRPSQLSCARR